MSEPVFAARKLSCCGGTTDGATTTHEPWCPSVIRSALSWVEDTRHGEGHRQRGTAALDALLERLAEAERMLALCAADTTAPDLAQEVEFLEAELAQSRVSRETEVAIRRRLEGALVAIIDQSKDEPGGLNFANRAFEIARDALGWENESRAENSHSEPDAP